MTPELWAIIISSCFGILTLIINARLNRRTKAAEIEDQFQAKLPDVIQDIETKVWERAKETLHQYEAENEKLREANRCLEEERDNLAERVAYLEEREKELTKREQELTNRVKYLQMELGKAKKEIERLKEEKKESSASSSES